MELELIERRVGDCGCAEEEYDFEGWMLTVHFEDDGWTDAHLDGADYGEATRSLLRPSNDEGREAVFLWAYFTIHQDPAFN